MFVSGWQRLGAALGGAAALWPLGLGALGLAQGELTAFEGFLVLALAAGLAAGGYGLGVLVGWVVAGFQRSGG